MWFGLDIYTDVVSTRHFQTNPTFKCLQTPCCRRNRARNEEQTSMLVALSFSSITCFRMVRDDLMASFNVMDCQLPRERGTNRKDATRQSRDLHVLPLLSTTCAYMGWKNSGMWSVPCGRPLAENFVLPQTLSRWPEHHTAQRFLMDPCGTCIHKQITVKSLWSQNQSWTCLFKISR